uniref:Uncharacterized protein n=1 Tax=Pavo cristatus TaxID=9049 RepID=A0A8C9LDJ4_PAVCR
MKRYIIIGSGILLSLTWGLTTVKASTFLSVSPLKYQNLPLQIMLPGFVKWLLIFCTSVSYNGCPVPPLHQSLHPIHQRHITVPTSIPQQQVFALAEPKRKPSLFWHTFNKLTPFKK